VIRFGRHRFSGRERSSRFRRITEDVEDLHERRGAAGCTCGSHGTTVKITNLTLKLVIYDVFH